MEHQNKASPCAQPMYGGPQKCSTTSNGKKSYILTQKINGYSYYSPTGPLMSDAVAIGFSANYQLPIDAVLRNHPAADLHCLNSGMIFQPDAISLSEASICSSMETWTPDIQTNATSDTQSVDLLTQPYQAANANFCYNNRIDPYTLNNSSSQFYPEEHQPNATTNQQWNSSSSSTGAPYTYYLQQQTNDIDHSNNLWLHNAAPLTTPSYTQTAITDQIQYNSTCIKSVPQDPSVINMCLSSSNNNSYIYPSEQVSMQQQELSADETNHNQEDIKTKEHCKHNRRHTVSLPFIDGDCSTNDDKSDERRQSIDGINQDQLSFGHLSREELIQRVVQLEKEKEFSKLSVSATEKQSSALRTAFTLSPDGSDEEEVHPCLWANCHITTSSLEQLIEHIRDLHIGSGKAAYYCEWSSCPRNQKPFMKRHKMQNHMRTHTGERPFVCHIEGCDKKFSRPDSLNTHIKTHSSIRPYVCPVPGCGKAYFHSRSLRKHSKSHENGASDRSCYPYERSMKFSRYQASQSDFMTPPYIQPHSQHLAAGPANTTYQSYLHPHPIEYAHTPGQQYTY